MVRVSRGEVQTRSASTQLCVVLANAASKALRSVAEWWKAGAGAVRCCTPISAPEMRQPVNPSLWLRTYNSQFSSTQWLMAGGRWVGAVEEGKMIDESGRRPLHSSTSRPNATF